MSYMACSINYALLFEYRKRNGRYFMISLYNSKTFKIYEHFGSGAHTITVECRYLIGSLYHLGDYFDTRVVGDKYLGVT